MTDNLKGRLLSPISLVLMYSILFFLLLNTNMFGDIYKWVDEKGVAHFTDNPENIHSGARIEALEAPVYKEQNMPPKMEHRSFSNSDKPPRDEESTDRLLREVWRDHRNALSRGDIDSALSFMHPRNKEKYKIMFAAVKDKLQMILDTHVEIKKISIDKITATYNLRTNENGKIYSYDLNFAIDKNGVWKILNY